MTLLGSTEFLWLLRGFRVVWVKGRYGGGKTRLAYALADELLKSGDYRYLVGNSGSVWRDELWDVRIDDAGTLDAVVIMDEGGIFLRFADAANELLSFLRKLNLCLLIPSVLPVSMRLRALTVQREWDLSPFGIPVEIWRWVLEGEEGLFYNVNPSQYHGVYDTQDMPVDDGGVVDWLHKAIELERERRGKSHQLSERLRRASEGSGSLSSMAFGTGALEEAADAIAGSARSLSVSARSIGKTRKRG